MVSMMLLLFITVWLLSPVMNSVTVPAFTLTVTFEPSRVLTEVTLWFIFTVVLPVEVPFPNMELYQSLVMVMCPSTELPTIFPSPLYIVPFSLYRLFVMPLTVKVARLTQHSRHLHLPPCTWLRLVPSR